MVHFYILPIHAWGKFFSYMQKPLCKKINETETCFNKCREGNSTSAQILKVNLFFSALNKQLLGKTDREAKILIGR